MSTTGVHQCSATVFGERVQHWQCSRQSSVCRDGQWYCRQHDPETIRDRREAADAKQVAADKAENAIRKQAVKLARRLGCGSPEYYSGGYRRGIVISFEDAEALLKVLAR